MIKVGLLKRRKREARECMDENEPKRKKKRNENAQKKWPVRMGVGMEKRNVRMS